MRPLNWRVLDVVVARREALSCLAPMCKMGALYVGWGPGL